MVSATAAAPEGRDRLSKTARVDAIVGTVKVACSPSNAGRAQQQLNQSDVVRPY